ncbi:hypothetical protein RYX36_017933 [Vicia faba]
MHPPVGFTFVFVSHYILQVPSLCFQKAKIHSVLDWHHLHLNLRRRAAAEAEKVLASSLSTIENIWLKGDGQFSLGSFRSSIADLSLVC